MVEKGVLWLSLATTKDLKSVSRDNNCIHFMQLNKTMCASTQFSIAMIKYYDYVNMNFVRISLM